MNTVNLTMIALPAGLFSAMMAAAIVGHRIAVARSRADDADDAPGTSAVDAAVLGLLGLLVAFWFSSAGTRLDVRRSLIVEEANAIGTAWLRLDLLPSDGGVAERPATHDRHGPGRASPARVFRPVPHDLTRGPAKAAAQATGLSGVPRRAGVSDRVALRPAANRGAGRRGVSASCSPPGPPCRW